MYLDRLSLLCIVAIQTLMAMMDMNDSCIQVDSRPKSIGLVGGHCAVVRSSRELSELSQWLCQSAVNTDLGIIIVVVVVVVVVICSKM